MVYTSHQAGGCFVLQLAGLCCGSPAPDHGTFIWCAYLSKLQIRSCANRMPIAAGNKISSSVSSGNPGDCVTFQIKIFHVIFGKENGCLYCLLLHQSKSTFHMKARKIEHTVYNNTRDNNLCSSCPKNENLVIDDSFKLSGVSCGTNLQLNLYFVIFEIVLVKIYTCQKPKKYISRLCLVLLF